MSDEWMVQVMERIGRAIACAAGGAGIGSLLGFYGAVTGAIAGAGWGGLS